MNPKTVAALCVVAWLAGLIGCAGKDHFVDSRDGQKYRVVQMPDGKIWMAENLNFETSGGSWCYRDSVSYCDIYGRLYDWNTAMSACPQKWRLPSHEEWEALIDLVGERETAAAKLKTTSGWYINPIDVTDEFGFSALPGGNRWINDTDDDFVGIGFGGVSYRGYWWSATEHNATRAWGRFMGYNFRNTSGGTYDKNQGHSVRCVRD